MTDWADTNLNIAVGDELYIGGSTQNATSGNGTYLTVASINNTNGGNDTVITFSLAQGQTLATEDAQKILVAPVVTDLSSIDKSSLAGNGVTDPTVSISNSGNAGTITLQGGQTWAQLDAAYQIGAGIFIGDQGTNTNDPNANGSGTSFSNSADESVLHDQQHHQ